MGKLKPLRPEDLLDDDEPLEQPGNDNAEANDNAAPIGALASLTASVMATTPEERQRAREEAKAGRSKAQDDAESGFALPDWWRSPKVVFNSQDDQLAHLLAEAPPMGLKGRVRYDWARGQWFIWTGTRWKPDTTMRMHQLVRDCFSTWVATEKVTKDDVKLMASILNTAKKRSVLDALASYPGIAMTGDEWDRNWWQLGVRNGVVDLRDLTFTPKGDPDDLITKSAGADWDSTLTDADAPVFMANLAEITARADGTPDPDAMEHLLLVLGYALFGALFEEIFEEWVGHGRNGKGKLKDIVLHVFGDYGMTLPAGFYMVSRDGPPDSARPRPELLKIMGIRIGFDSEPEGGRLNDQRLKKHSGGDEETARNLHDKHYVTFLPTHLTVILTNNVLKLENVDPAIESRLIVRPFDRRFDVDTDPPADTARLARMKRESSAILGILARRAARYWQLAKPQAGEDGTRIVIKANMPDRIRLAGQLNLAESDRFRAALAEAFIRDPEAFSSQDELHRKYTEWFKDPETDDPGTWLSKPDLMKKLRGAGFEEGRRKSGTVRGFVGIRPNNAMDLPPEPPADPSDDDEIADQSDQSDQSEGGR